MDSNYILLRDILKKFDQNIIDTVLSDLKKESAKDKKNDRKRAYTKYNNKVGRQTEDVLSR